MNEKLHTAATAVGFGIGAVLILAGVAASMFPQFGANPAPAIEWGGIFVAGSGLLQLTPKVGG